MNLQDTKANSTRQDTHYTILAKTVLEAQTLFARGVTNLLAINEWQDIAGGTLSFQLVNENGTPIYTTPRKSNLIRVGNPSSADEECGWLRIERIDHYKTSLMESTIIRVQPAHSPTSKPVPKNNPGPDAANNFSVERMGKKVTAAVHGREGHPRIQSLARPGKLKSIFYHLGILIGLNKSVWKALVKGMLQKEVTRPNLAK